MRGRSLLQLCNDYELDILNGNPAIKGTSDAFTSFQPQGNSVIDYAAVNETGLSTILEFSVLPLQQHWADHAPLALVLNIAVPAPQPPLQKKIYRPMSTLPASSPLDQLFIRVLNSKLTPEQRLAKLYGPILATSAPIHIYIDGACLGNGTKNARAGSGVFWGDGNALNLAERVPGTQTNNRGEVFALLRLLQIAHPTDTLHIFCDSEYTIETIASRAADNEDCGWNIPNGDLFREIVQLIRRRAAAIQFIQVKGHSGNHHHDAADLLAKAGARMATVNDFTATIFPPFITPVSQPDQPGTKVTATMLPKRKPPVPPPTDKSESHHSALTAHRHRPVIAAKQLEFRKKLLEAKTEREFWRVAKDIMGTKKTTSNFSAEALKNVFEKRMNPIVPMPETFDPMRMQYNHTLAAAIPEHTIDTTPEHFFSAPFTVEDVAEAKDRLSKHPENSARGWDQVSYTHLCELENDDLCLLANQCVSELDAPSACLLTILIGLIKKGKPKQDPESFRTVGLESCFTKFMTLLIHMRITKWCVANDLLPPSQNGFREGFRTNDNVFILRCAIDRARAQGEPLYVVYADLSNAFPSTEQSTLWVKMHSMGAAGGIFDWLRMLYKRMAYIVRHEAEMSAIFKSLIGILIGDTSSPMLWTIYLSDFRIPSDATHDILLAGILLAHLEHADDIALVSRTAQGAQRNMTFLWNWCNLNFMILNAIKSLMMIFGALPPVVPGFYFGKEAVDITCQQTYVGITLRSTHRNIFAEHYSKKASKARSVSNTIFGLESMVGTLAPWEGRKLYMAQVDPHLIHGCDISLDVDPKLLEPLEDIQHSFLRRLLGVNKRAMLAPLFTETGLVPLRFRRIILALGYLRYLIKLPPERYARQALNDSLSLAANGKSSWIMDIQYVIHNLPFQVNMPDLMTVTPQAVDDIIKSINAGAQYWLQSFIDTSPKLYLLRGRLEPDKDSPPRHKTLCFRHYLNVGNPEHRKALTKLLLSSHCLAMERLRWIDHRRPRIDPELRLCRFCKTSIETPEHALLECNSNQELVIIRSVFLTKMKQDIKNLPSFQSISSEALLRNLISHRHTIGLVAKYTHEVLSLFDATPMLVPALPLHWLITQNAD